MTIPLAKAQVRFCPRCYGLVESFMDNYPDAGMMCSTCYRDGLDADLAKYTRRAYVTVQVAFWGMLLAFVSLIVAVLT